MFWLINRWVVEQRWRILEPDEDGAASEGGAPVTFGLGVLIDLWFRNIWVVVFRKGLKKLKEE